MIKAGIFDFYGVVTPDYFVPVHKEICQHFNITLEQFLEVWKLLYPDFETNKLSEEEFWQKLKEITGSTKPLPDKEIFIREYSKYFKRDEELIRVIHSLKKQGLKLAILSNVIKPHADYNRKVGAYEEFDIIALSNEQERKKPDLDFFKYAIDKLEIKPEEAFFVDDKEKYITVANNLGLHGIHFKNTEYLIEELKKLNIYV